VRFKINLQLKVQKQFQMYILDAHYTSFFLSMNPTHQLHATLHAAY